MVVPFFWNGPKIINYYSVFITSHTILTIKKNKLFKSLQIPAVLCRYTADGMIPHKKHNQERKKVLPFTSLSLRGSLTIEAALGLSIFLMFSYSLIEPMRWLDHQRIIQAEADALCERLSMEDHDPLTNMAEEQAEALFLSAKITEKTGKLQKLRTEVEIMRDQEDMIYAKVSYCEVIPFLFGGIREFPVRTVAARRAFTGHRGSLKQNQEDLEEQVMVYVGKDRGRYHWYRDCHYISNEYRTVGADEVREIRNSESKRYRPCEKCGNKAVVQRIFYVTPGGECYHTDPACPSMLSYVRQVPLDEVRDLGACSYCQRRKEHGE